MIYLFDKQQNITGIINENDLIAGELDFKINNAISFDFTLPINKSFDDSVKYVSIQHPNDKSKHLLFRLMSRSDNADSIEFTASELAYQELSSYGYIQDKRPDTTDAKSLMTMALDGSNWNLGIVNVSVTAKTNFYYVTNLEAIQKVVLLMAGEISFYVTIDNNKITGRYMDYVAQQGEDTSKVFAQGSNLLTVTKKKQTDSIYTAILPRGKGEQVSSGTDTSPDGYGRRIDISDVVWSKLSGNPLDKEKGSLILSDPVANAEWSHIDGNYRLLPKTYDDIEDPNELIQQAYLTLMSVNHPQIQYSATVANVGRLSLGDTVLIMHSERNMSYKTRVFEVKYNIVQPEQTEISLGDDLSSNSITSTINSISSQIATNSNQVQWNISNGGHNNTSYGSTQPTNPRQGDVWFKYLPNGNTEEYYYNGSIWVLGSETDQQWKENTAIQQGSNTVFYGTETPTGAVIGDTWFKNDNNEPDGKAMYTYSGTTWVKFTGGADASRLQIGTIDASKINVMNLSADNIVTGNLSANFIKGGQLDFSQINGININASNIVTGSITGNNLKINLNTGQVIFQKGRIYNANVDATGFLQGGIDINIDNQYISAAGYDSKVIIKGGELGFVEKNIFDLSDTPYLKISNTFSGSSFSGATFNGRDYAVLTNDANKGNIYTVPIGVESFSGVSTGKPVGWEPTKVGGADRGVIISGGSTTNMGFIDSGSPYIFVGSDSSGNNWYGDRVFIRSSYTHLPSSYNRTTSNGANVFIAGDGALVRSSSSSKYKLDIEYEQQADTANKLLTLDPATWHDKFESEQLYKFHEIGVDPERAIDMSNRRYYGIIAEDLVKAGLEHLVSRNVETGEVEGVEYSKIGVALIPIIRDLRNRLNEQYVEIERLKEKIK